MNSALTPRIQRKEMTQSLLALLLIGAFGSAAAESTPTGSRAHRPEIKEPTQSAPTTGLAHPENARPLNADHLAAIQVVGRTVLAAKHSVQPDPAVEAMRQQLKAVSTELVLVFRDGSTSKPVLRLGNKKNPTGSTQANHPTNASATLAADSLPVRRLVPGAEPQTFVEETVVPSPSRSAPGATSPLTPVSAQNADAWHRDVASLQSRLTSARAQAPVIADAPEAKTPMRRPAAEKQTQLLDDIQRAVDAQDTTQLAALRDRLTPRRLPAERERLRALADPEHKARPVAPSPTVSTLTRHR